MAAMTQEITGLKDKSKFVPREMLRKETEAKNLAESELRSARDEISKLESQLSAVKGATDAASLNADLEAKSKEIERLSENYRKLNEDRNKLETALKTAKDRVVTLEAEVDSLRAQFGESAAATLPVASVSGEIPVEPILQETLLAITALQKGNQAQALASLKDLETKHPNTPGLKEAIAALSPEQPKEEALKEATATATSTPVPTKAPTPSPTRKKRPKPTPTAKPIPTPSGPITPAKPRPIGRPSKKVAESPKPKVQPRRASTRSTRDDRALRLQKQKAVYTQQAFQAYKRRDFARAKQLVDRAYRIDPKDPAVRQLRGAIERALKQ